MQSLFEHPLIKKDFIERRVYQERLAVSVLEKGNTLIVAPTAMGKTIIAVLVAASVLEKGKKVLMLAPTRPLAMQHANTFKELLNVPRGKIILVTGKTPAKHRYLAYKEASVVSATPQCVENDLKQKLINTNDFGLCVFDEAHRAVGNYAYVFIAKHFKNCLVLALTASPGHEKEKIAEICKNLGISNIEVVTEHDSDVKQYAQPIEISWLKVSLPTELEHARKLLKTLIENFGKELEKYGFKMRKQFLYNRAKLLELQKEISNMLEQKKSDTLFEAASLLAALIKANHAIVLLETQGTKAFCAYIESLKQNISSKADVKLLGAKELKDAYAIAKALSDQNIVHPKVSALVRILKEELAKNPNAKIIVFNHYRDSVEELERILNENEIKAKRFIGQAKRKSSGMSQKEQKETLEAFRKGKLNVLIATSVGEEGLDVPSCDLVIFFEPVASEIRHIQRKGRTARKRKGRVLILITRKTRDESYYWSAKRREREMLRKIKELKEEQKQKTLMHFSD